MQAQLDDHVAANEEVIMYPVQGVLVKTIFTLCRYALCDNWIHRPDLEMQIKIEGW